MEFTQSAIAVQVCSGQVGNLVIPDFLGVQDGSAASQVVYEFFQPFGQLNFVSLEETQHQQGGLIGL